MRTLNKRANIEVLLAVIIVEAAEVKAIFGFCVIVIVIVLCCLLSVVLRCLCVAATFASALAAVAAAAFGRSWAKTGCYPGETAREAKGKIKKVNNVSSGIFGAWKGLG